MMIFTDFQSRELKGMERSKNVKLSNSDHRYCKKNKKQPPQPQINHCYLYYSSALKIQQRLKTCCTKHFRDSGR